MKRYAHPAECFPGRRDWLLVYPAAACCVAILLALLVVVVAM